MCCKAKRKHAAQEIGELRESDLMMKGTKSNIEGEREREKPDEVNEIIPSLALRINLTTN